MKHYKVVPCINSQNNKKGYKIVDKEGIEYCPDGVHFTVYYKYEQAEDHCRHLNGNSRVWGIVDQDHWEYFKKFMGVR